MTTEPKAIEAALADLQAAQPDQELRYAHEFTVGAIARQGDVYLQRMPDGWPRGEPVGPQLAPGTTQGARHIAEAPCFAGVQMPSEVADEYRRHGVERPEAMLGPVVVSPERWLLRHPEHADHSYPAGTYQCWGQWNDRTKSRTQD